MIAVDGFELAEPGLVVGIDLSLTAPGIAALYRPWGSETPRAVATTQQRVPPTTASRGLVLQKAAAGISRTVERLATREDEVLVVIESVLLQSTTGKATERAAFWWMVRAELELSGYAVTSVHPTTRRSLGLDAEAQAWLRSLSKEERKKRGKVAVLQSQRRRWPGVILPDDNAADALVCAELGARALGWAGLPPLDNKNLSGAIRALGIEKKEMAR